MGDDYTFHNSDVNNLHHDHATIMFHCLEKFTNEKMKLIKIHGKHTTI